MPVPFLLAGIGVVAGIGIHADAKDTNEIAEKKYESAQNLYNNARHSLEQAQNQTEKSLLKLGYQKKNILDSSMKKFLDSYDKIKHIQVTGSAGLDEISNFFIDQQGGLRLREMTNIYSSLAITGATGLATGGLALALGEASGIVGSALPIGAAITPLAAIAAPTLLFTGLSSSKKAYENLEKAITVYAEAEKACEKMKVSEMLCNGLSNRSEMFSKLLLNLDGMFAECSEMLNKIIREKEKIQSRNKLNSNDFTQGELELISVTRSLAGAIKTIIDTPILSKDGKMTNESKNVYDQTSNKLSDFGKNVDKVKKEVVKKEAFGVAKNKTETFKRCMEAAQQGDVDAQCQVGCYYHNGTSGIAQNHKKAEEWLKKSAAQGNDLARDKLWNWYHIEIV